MGVPNFNILKEYNLKLYNYDIVISRMEPENNIEIIIEGYLDSKKERDLAHKIRLMGMGQSPSVMYKNKRAWTYDVEVHGYRYHLANLHAAIGVSQIEDFLQIKKTRINTVKYYNKNIKDNPSLEKPILNQKKF